MALAFLGKLKSKKRSDVETHLCFETSGNTVCGMPKVDPRAGDLGRM